MNSVVVLSAIGDLTRILRQDVKNLLPGKPIFQVSKRAILACDDYIRMGIE
jgi:hypothetical protein